MQIPEYFSKKIIRVFGEKGRDWLTELPQIFNQCIQKWNLIEGNLSNDLSFNLVCFAKSPEYGDVALKIGVPHPELFTEMEALTLYQGRNICTCYDLDKELGAMLLERIIPGPNLETTPNLHNQLLIAADLISQLPIPISSDHGLPTYADWVERTFAKVRKNDKVDPVTLTFVDEAESMFSEIKSWDCPPMLLHGDLHHKNILQKQDGSWVAIDPKGVVGVACMESARFITCHMEFVTGETERVHHLDDMITVFSKKFGESKWRIAVCLFVLCVVSVCWRYDEVNPEQDSLATAINECKFVLDYIKNL